MHTFPREYYGKITSIRQLWEVLYGRLDGSILAHEYVLKEPHDYFWGGRPGQVECEPTDGEPYGELLEQSPAGIRNLTESILQNLEPIPTDLPTNLTRNVRDTDDLPWANNLQNAELICNCAYSQDWWCEALINTKMFPWLWDIDTHMIRERQKTGHWNWELLARQLSQIVIHDPDDKTLNSPLVLRNCRRIWRILEEGKIDDVAEPKEEQGNTGRGTYIVNGGLENWLSTLRILYPQMPVLLLLEVNLKVPKAEAEKFS
ncbi:hypothetical protein OIDMADRAFT_61296 [Oidiodendron maius Zn]|uniref:Uncharacterized protein n=1 Tax=Oidiodendron maius (strain Zn) TaxID=913774 RepID=A0A0C3C453_OIDMZ|nr:hypothetical protein OIDMADRAFT_61296 [Oidiodendron maius Zn]